jgi:hypothetical protein
MIEGGEPAATEIELTSQLIIRASTGPPPDG